MRFLILWGFGGVVCMLSLAAAQSPLAALPSDADIRAILAKRIDGDRRGVGIVVGVIEPSGRRVVGYGTRRTTESQPVDGDTVFEIGSVSKVFTSLLLVDMARQGLVLLDDPVDEYLPSETRVPARGGRAITLQDLATHTSGLPRLPTNLVKNPANPYADYSVDDLYQFLSGYTLTRDIGSQYEYSNVGVGLLGHALARRAATTYEALVRTRICEPLGMRDTRITLSQELGARFAAGHNPRLEAVGPWDIPTLAGAGALRSTANDLLRFLAVHLGSTESPLSAAIGQMLTVRRPGAIPGLQAALGWHISAPFGQEIVWHGGDTGGYSAFIAYVPERRTAVVVLANARDASGSSMGDIGLHILDPRVPLSQPPRTRTEVSVDAKCSSGMSGAINSHRA